MGIIQYNFDGVEINRYPSQGAAARAVGAASSHMSRAVNNEITCKGFIWRTEDYPLTTLILEKILASSNGQRGAPKRAVVKIDLKLGKPVYFYRSMLEAAAANGLSAAAVLQDCRKTFITERRKRPYIFQFIEDYRENLFLK